MGRKYHDLNHKKFGRLSVIERSLVKNKKGEFFWKCECQCGKEKLLLANNLLRGKTNSCGCLRKEMSFLKYKDREEFLWQEVYRRGIVRRAKDDNFELDIDFDFFKSISVQPCYYCQVPFSHCKKDIYKQYNKIISDTVIYYNGIDRVDSSKGYLKNNVVPCCNHCNTAKNSFTQEEFKNHIKKIYESMKERNLI